MADPAGIRPSRPLMSLERRRFMTAIAGGLLAAPFVADAQQPGSLRRIGYLGVNRPEDLRHQLEALRLGLQEHGWVEGRNLHINYRWAEGKSDRLARLADELVKLKVELLIVPATQAIAAAKTATRDIPIIMVAASNDPVADGFVSSLARPGGNITGLTFDPGPEIGGKQLELLVQTIPGLSRAAVLANPENPAHGFMSDPMRAAARSLGVQLKFFEARSPGKINDAMVDAMKWRADAMLVQSDAVLFGQRKPIANLAARSRLPTIYPWRDTADAGGFMVYGANISDNFRRAASFVNRILNGAKPADLPVERPTKFEFVINLKTAKALGLTIPQPLLARADEVIE